MLNPHPAAHATISIDGLRLAHDTVQDLIQGIFQYIKFHYSIAVTSLWTYQNIGLNASDGMVYNCRYLMYIVYHWIVYFLEVVSLFSVHM